MKANNITKLAAGARVLAIAGIVALVLLACENPFRAGLGEIVDMHYPTVTLRTPGGGSFIRGNQELAGVAWDDLRVESVEIWIVQHPGVRAGYAEIAAGLAELSGWRIVGQHTPRGEHGDNWTHNIPTNIFYDGELRLLLRVTDGSGKTLDPPLEVVLFINNDPPTITMDFPPLATSEYPHSYPYNRGQLGGYYLNFGFAHPDRGLVYLNRRVDGRVGMVMVTIAYGEELFLGDAYPLPQSRRFPPQFRVWEVKSLHDESLPGFGTRPIPPGELPGEDDVPWQRLGEDPHSRLATHSPGSRRYSFTFPPGAQNRFFAFQVRAQSAIVASDGADYEFATFRFPRDKWSDYRWYSDRSSPEQRYENSFVAFFLAGPQEPPRIDLLGLQDIFTPGAWDLDRGEYRDMVVGEGYPYLTDTSFVKDGPFTLRVRAFHPEGIDEAMAFWVDGERRLGRFIWNTPGMDTVDPFSGRGLSSPNLSATRHFVFDSNRSGSRTELFDGNGWEGLFEDIALNWNYLRDGDHWEPVGDLGEGTFTIKVYARTDMGTVSDLPMQTELVIDRTPPTIGLTRVEGSAWVRDVVELNEQATVVNGVIRPHFSVSDGVGLYSDEVVYVLVRDSDRGVINGLLPYIWSLPPGDPRVYMHGRTSGRDLTIRTPEILYPEVSRLYRLYLFARDRALNLGMASFLLCVDPRSDFPQFDFSMRLVSDAVRDPNLGADCEVPGCEDPYCGAGFIFGGTVRNMLRPTHDISFTIRDDDSIDLASLRIYFTGSYVDVDGEIRRLPGDFASFGFPLGGSPPVRSVEVTIPQLRLLDHLRDNLTRYAGLFYGATAGYTSLPDGIYYMRMVVRDDPYHKLYIDDREDYAESYVYFWIVVDNQPPRIESDNVPRLLTPEYDGVPSEGRFVTGTVHDENGPIALDFFRVRLVGGNWVNICDIGSMYGASLYPVDLPNRFRASVDLPPVFGDLLSGEFDFEFSVRDRFGQSTVHRWRYAIDWEPPTVVLRSRISYFSRPSVAGTYICERNPGGIYVSPANAARLANQVLSFTVHATDNNAVEGIHWWLLPANAGSVSSFWDNPANMDDDLNVSLVRYFETNGVRGAFGRIAAADGVAVVDTMGLGLPDGEYRLYVIALDGAGNQSTDPDDITGHMQTIFLLQEEDRPYFVYWPESSGAPPGAVRPTHGEVLGHDIFVIGTVTDDDGFGTGMFPDAGTVRIWVSSNPSGVTLSTGALDASPDWSEGRYVTTGLDLIDGTNLVMEIDLLALFRDFFDEKEGPVYYVIRVQDSTANKIALAGQSADRVASYAKFWFMRDINPPDLYLANPLPGQTVGWSDDLTAPTNTLFLSGSISDANLSMDDGSPYLMWRLNGSDLAILSLYGYITYEYMVGGIRTVQFLVPTSTVLPLFIGYLNQDGSNTLELRVDDLTGAFAEVSPSFVIDRYGPAITLGITEVRMDSDQWWNTDPLPGNAGDWQCLDEYRRRWAADRDLPVITPEGVGQILLRGHFADGVSYIDVHSARARINDEPLQCHILPTEMGRLVNWELSLSDLPDGVHTVSIEVSDVAGNRTESYSFAFRVDSEAPDVEIDNTHPVLGVFPDGFARRFAVGTARDANLRDVRLELRRNGALVPPAGGGDFVNLVATYEANRGTAYQDDIGIEWHHPDNGYPMELEWGLNLESVFGVSISEDGSYEILARAVDWSGALSDPYRWSFTRDVTPPNVDFGGLGTTADGYLTPAELQPGHEAFNRIDRGTVRVTVADERSNIREVRALVQQWDWVTGAWLTVENWYDITADLGGTPRNRIWDISLEDEGLYRVMVRAWDSAWLGDDLAVGNYAESHWLYFFYDRGNPVIEFSPPSIMSSRFGTGAPGPGQLGFTVSAGDDNRIRRITASVATVGTSTGESIIDEWASAGITRTILVPVPVSAPGGTYSVTITATDLAGRTTTVSRNITLDNTGPAGAFNAPALDPVDGNVTYSVNLLSGNTQIISGAVSDPSGIETVPVTDDSRSPRLFFRLGLLDDEMPTAETLMQYYTGDDTADPALDTAHNNSHFSSWHQVRYGATAANGMLPTGFELLEHQPWNWRLEVPVNDLMGPGMTRPSPTHVGILELPIWFRTVDYVGNAGYFHRVIRINPDAERPLLTVNDPSANAGIGDQRGGTVTFGGGATIESDVNVQAVLYRVWVGGLGVGDNPTRPGHSVTAGEMRIPAGDERLATTAEVNLLDAGLRDGTWFHANRQGTGRIVPWAFSLNAGGEIADLIATRGFAYPAGGGEYNTIRVWVEMVAIGATGQVSATVVRSLYLRSSAPQITQVWVNGGLYWDMNPNPPVDDWHDADPRRGLFTIRATLDASAGQTISEVRIARPDELTDTGARLAWRQEGLSGAGTPLPLHGLTIVPRDDADGGSEYVPGTGHRFWTLTYVLDSTRTTTYGTAGVAGSVGTIRGGGWSGTGGEFRVEIRVRDDSDPRAETSLTVPIVIDNFTPAVDSRFNANRFQAGTSGLFQGRTFDFAGAPGAFAHPAGVDRVYAWFERTVGAYTYFVPLIDENGNGTGPFLAVRRNIGGNTTVHNVLTGRTATATMDAAGATVTSVAVVSGLDGTVYSPTIADNAATYGGGQFVRVISQRRAAASEEAGRGLLWYSPGGDPRDVLWQFTVDTTRLGDGPIRLRYIVVDTAGNRSLHEQHIIIMNNAPMFDRVVLHSSLVHDRPAVMDQEDGDDRAHMVLTSHQLGQIRPEGFIDTPGFIVRNRFLGFTVETVRGNEPLRYRLQPVTRETVPLATVVTQRTATGFTPPAGMINLYTIATVGDVSAYIWNSLGVVGEPAVGMHFVFRSTGELPDTFPGANVWRYTVIGDMTRNHTPSGGANPRLVLPNSPTWPGSGATPDWFEAGHGFNFAGLANFTNYPPYGHDSDVTFRQDGRIPQFLLDAEQVEGAASDPNAYYRPFFLLRVWDSLTAGDAGGLASLPEEWQLHAAAVIYMDIHIYDDMPPVIQLYDLNPFFERGVVRGNLPDTIVNALDPLDMYVERGSRYRNMNRMRGGLFNVGTEREPARSGHIDPRSTSSIFTDSAIWDGSIWAPRPVAERPVVPARDGFIFTRDQVSGQVILRGRATDNRRLRYVDLAIVYGREPLATDWFRILQLDGESMVPVAGAWHDTADIGVDCMIDIEHGHVAEWSFRWDTEAFNINADAVTATMTPINGAPRSDVRIRARVMDDEPEITRFATGFNVDIVPFVTGFERHERYADTRSLQGWHSFYQGEAGISAVGWNLGNPGTTPTMNLRHAASGSGSYTPVDTRTPVARRTAVAHGDTMLAFTFTVPTAARSGRMEITTAGAGARVIHNHSSDPRQFWNRDNLLGFQSELWINRPYAHIWRTRHEADVTPRTYMGPFANSVGLDHPGMALEFYPATNAGRLHGAWSVYGTEMIHFGRNDGSAISGTGADSTRLNIGTPPREPFVEPDISMFDGAGTPNIVFTYQYDGNASVRFRANVNVQGTEDLDVGGTATISAGSGDFPMLITHSGGSTNRWQNIRTSKAAPGVDADNNPGRLFTSVYDADQGRLMFASRIGGTSAQVIIDGPGAITGATGTLSPSTNAGEFSAIGFDAVGGVGTEANRRPIIAYYDVSNDTLRIAFATTYNPTGATTWRRQYVFEPGHALHRGSGRHVSMAIDAANNIHLAFFSRTHGLVYVRLNARTAATQATLTRATYAVIDNVNGSWTDISVDHWGNPWIVYGYQGRQGNFDGIRMAYFSGVGPANAGAGRDDVNFNTRTGGRRPSSPLRCRVTSTDITGWETVSMAAPFRVGYDRLNIEAWPPTNRRSGAAATRVTMAGGHQVGGREWSAAIGYASGAGDNRFRIGYFFRPTWLGAD